MSNGVLSGKEKQAQFLIEAKITTDENELNIVINEVRSGKKTIADVKSVFEDMVSQGSHAVPVLTSTLLAAFPESDVFTNEYLHIRIVNAYDIRIMSGDKEAAKLKDTYLRMLGKKVDHLTTSPNELEQ